jgi:hypothetical protein
MSARPHLSKNGKPLSKEMGLGCVHDVSLSEARELRDECRKLLGEGQDPIEAKREKRRQAAAERAKSISFKERGEACIGHHRAHRQQPTRSSA